MSVHFADATTGWIGVEDGILGSADGGGTWVRQLQAEPIGQIWSIDQTHAWALAGEHLAYRTRDGSHWTPLPITTPSTIVDLDFIDADRGWAIAAPPPPSPTDGLSATAGTLLATTDGGRDWEPITSQSLWSVCFFDDRTGLGAAGKQIFRTGDGGRTWALVADLTIGARGPWFPRLICADRQDARVQITEPYAALSHVPYVVFRTTDGGSQWQLEYVEGYTLGTLFPSSTPGLGSYPSQLGILPGGHTWVLTCSPPADTQALLTLDADGTVLERRSVPFVACARATVVDEQHAWALATIYGNDRSRGVVVRTSDGGASWEYVYPR